MGYSYDFKNNELYSADDINAIRASLINKGIIGGTSAAFKVTVSDGKVFVSEGAAVFEDGSRLNIDSDGVELEYIPDVINYVYLLNDTGLNKNTVNVSTDEPVGDYIMLAEIDETGEVEYKRTYSTAKYSALGAQRCFVKFFIPGKTNGWDGTTFEFLGTLNVDKNLRAVTIQNKYDYNIPRQETAFIHDTTVEMRVYNSDANDDIDIKITPDFELWVRAKIDYTAILVFENMTEGSIEYA